VLWTRLQLNPVRVIVRGCGRRIAGHAPRARARRRAARRAAAASEAAALCPE
jgi:hypothetical protein